MTKTKLKIHVFIHVINTEMLLPSWWEASVALPYWAWWLKWQKYQEITLHRQDVILEYISYEHAEL